MRENIRKISTFNSYNLPLVLWLKNVSLNITSYNVSLLNSNKMTPEEKGDV